MRTRVGVALAAALAVALGGCVVPPLPRGPWQLGAGASQAWIETDYAALGDQSAPGIDMVAGWGFGETWWLDASMSLGHRMETGTTSNIYYPPDHARFEVFSFDLRKEFWPAAQRGWAPWVLGGVSIADVSWDTYYYSVTAAGFVLGGGADLRLGDWPLAVRAQLLRHALSGEDTYGYGPYRIDSTVGSVLLVWTFGEDAASDH